MNMKGKNLILIGGSNVDTIGIGRDPLTPRASNIGKISSSFGGVMRNVAENLAFLNRPCPFLTPIGNDALGKKLKKTLEKEGVEVISPKTKLPTASYLAIHDCDHDLALALCDDRIVKDLSAAFLAKMRSLIASFSYVAIDTNLLPEAIEYLFKTFPKKRILCETISPIKAIRLKKHLKKIFLLKGNKAEAQALAETKETGEGLVLRLLEKGVKNVVVTHGGGDVYVGQAEKKEIVRLATAPAEGICNTTGCGDALFAGTIDRLTQGEDLIEAVRFGQRLAQITLKSDKATSKEIRSLACDGDGERRP